MHKEAGKQETQLRIKSGVSHLTQDMAKGWNCTTEGSIYLSTLNMPDDTL